MTLVANDTHALAQDLGLSQDYVPGTNLPKEGDIRTLSFESIWNKQRRCNQWRSVEDIEEGETFFVVNDKSLIFPTEDQPEWKVKINRIIVDVPHHDEPRDYHRVIIVDLFMAIGGNKKPEIHKTEPQRVQPTNIEAVAKKRELHGICFMESGDNLTFTFRREDGVIEEFILEGNRAGVIQLKGGDGTRFTNPLRVIVTREIDIRPKFKRYAVERT